MLISDTSEGLDEVDVAIVAESTYPFLRGGVSAVIQDIVVGNPDLTFGIIHITWDRSVGTDTHYAVPPNVRWVRMVYLSMQEHRADFMSLRPRALRMNGASRSRVSTRLLDALDALLDGDYAPAWEMYDEGMNPLTRQYPIWALLGSEEFMREMARRFDRLELPLTDTFWLLREFFSLSFALLDVEFPRAKVYHAHTTGYAGLVSSAAIRQQGGKFLLTEHNLYIRDTVNMLLDRSMALPVTARDWRDFDVPAEQRAWMAWWIEMGRLCYPSAAHVTYLYPDAIREAQALGAPTEEVSIVPNGMALDQFEGVYRRRLSSIDLMTTTDDHQWRLAYIARIVPIKGLLEFLDSARILLDRGITNWHLDVLGPTDHMPSYYEACRSKVLELDLADRITFRGTVDVRARLADIDLLVLPSYNEGQPMVVLEAMASGVPTVGTLVGGMGQLVCDPLSDAEGRVWESGGVLVDPTDIVVGMADAVQGLLADFDSYRTLAHNARGRVEGSFQLHNAMRRYNDLYRRLAGLPPLVLRPVRDGKTVATRPGRVRRPRYTGPVLPEWRGRVRRHA